MTAQRYRKIPKVITAIQYTGDNAAEILDAFGVKGISETLIPIDDERVMELVTVHGDTAYARASDWVTPDAAPATFYPINNEVFEDSYLPAGPELVKKEMTIEWPRLVDGDPVTADMLKKAWSEFMVPLQEAGRGGETNIKVLLTCFRNVYGGMQN